MDEILADLGRAAIFHTSGDPVMMLDRNLFTVNGQAA